MHEIILSVFLNPYREFMLINYLAPRAKRTRFQTGSSEKSFSRSHFSRTVRTFNWIILLNHLFCWIFPLFINNMKIYHSYLKLVTTITILFALHAHKVKSGTVPSLIFCFFLWKRCFQNSKPISNKWKQNFTFYGRNWFFKELIKLL